MFIRETHREIKGKIYRYKFIIEGRREKGKVIQKYLANLSKLPKELQDLIERWIKGERIFISSHKLRIISSLDYGGVAAMLEIWKEEEMDEILGLDKENRDLISALILNRIFDPN